VEPEILLGEGGAAGQGMDGKRFPEERGSGVGGRWVGGQRTVECVEEVVIEGQPNLLMDAAMTANIPRAATCNCMFDST
jgi:hypothetical protein